MFSEMLNPQQWDAVRHTEGPLMVVAGAGSGKTRVITCRIAYLIQDKHVRPDQILAITFTNKAATEMKERVRHDLGFRNASPWVSTFHSFCLRVLRRHIPLLKYSADFVIYDAQDQLSLVKQCLKAARMNEESTPPKAILNHLSGFKNDFLMPEDIDGDALPYGNRRKAAEVYPLYQEELKKNNALDFDDLLILAVRLFRDFPPVLEEYSDRFRYILVDEFQDTNLAQYHLIRLLSRKHNNICVVGDDDQSIYRWRGANLENILHFEKDFPGTTLVKLEENYRSTQTILQAAGAIVRENLQRKPKTLWTRNGTGQPVVLVQAEDEVGEAQTVCDKILRLNEEEGLSFNRMAVLYRTNAQSRVLEDRLRRMGIPHQVYGGLKFYARKEIKDVLAYMRVALNADDSVSLRRILNVPARGIGKTSLEKIEAWCRDHDRPLIEGLRCAEPEKLAASAPAKRMARFVQLMDDLAAVCRHRSPLELLAQVLEQSGYVAMLKKEDTVESRSRLENLQELYTAVEQAVEREGVGLQEFLDSSALVTDIDTFDDQRGVLPLMTLHTCKGLEFDAVFITGMENGLLPHASSLSDPEEYEEERRLCYVGCTRARRGLMLSHARRRRIYGNTTSFPPSDFLASIPAEILQVESNAFGAFRDSYRISSRPAAWDDSPGLAGSGQTPSDGLYPVGTKVLHPTFGKGVVVHREGGEDNLKVEVHFQRPHGKRKLAVNQARLIVL